MDGVNGRKALAIRNGKSLNPDHRRYEMILTDTETVTADPLTVVRRLAQETSG